jgi:guanylate kinase
VVISGPSGVGKSTVARMVLERSPGMVRSVSLTTRRPRGGDVDGEDYIFVSPEEFAAKRDAGKLLEWAEVYGNLYGTEAEQVDGRLAEGKSVLLEIDVQGGRSVKEARPGAILIFLMSPSEEVLEDRLRGRKTDDEETVLRRLENAKRELEESSHYDHVVVNDDLERCVGEVMEVIRSDSRSGAGKNADGSNKY